jgi:hypothetical protein
MDSPWRVKIGPLHSGQVPLLAPSPKCFLRDGEFLYRKASEEELFMRHVNAKVGGSKARSFAVGAGLICVCLTVALPAEAQVTTSVRGSHSTSRLLNAQQGRSIADAAWEQSEVASGQDCSHFVHQIYQSAGFEYPYASSFEIYSGDENFERVRIPQSGDLIVWPGHLGIVLDPVEHSFYSLVSTGWEAQDYTGPYWKSRGKPRFFRYRIGGTDISIGTRTSTTSEAGNPAKVVAEGSPPESSALNRPPKAVSERTPKIYGPPAPLATANATTPFEVPGSIIIAAGNKSPTRNEVAEGISELSSAAGKVLRTNEPLKLPLPLLIVERFSVESVEIKRDRGWAHLQIDYKVSLVDGETHLHQRREKIRWELRRTESGWEAVAPSDRTYVPRDVAVKSLATQLARLTESDGARSHPEIAQRQESQLAHLLSALLEDK